ncbi:MAG: protein translocase subunit SecF [Haloarculaceae archaeon]
MSGIEDLPDRFPDVDYTRYSNRQLAAIPLGLLALALLILVGWSLFVTGSPAQPGAPVSMGIDFTGGTQAHIVTTDSLSEVKSQLGSAERVQSVVGGSGGQNEYIVTLPPSVAHPTQRLSSAGYDVTSTNEIAASFGAGQVRLALIGILVAFLGMSIVIFVLFRTFVPSVAVIVSAFGDIVIPLALMNVLGIKLSLGTVAALLMLIGYSVDSDVLLTNHILRRRGGFYESAYRAMRTGVTMTLTSIAAMTVMAIVSYLLGMPLLPAIGLILVMGLVTDLMNTYLLNLSLLRWYKYEGVTR